MNNIDNRWYIADVDRLIQDAFADLLLDVKKEETRTLPQVKQIKWREKVQSWLECTEESKPPDDEPETQQFATSPSQSISEVTAFDDRISEESDAGSTFPHSTIESAPYEEIIRNSAAYAWLVGILQREAILQRAEQDKMEEIRSRLLRSFRAPRISRSSRSIVHSGIFILQWDPWAFVRNHGLSTEQPGQALLGAITFTGSPSDAQALMCSDYLNQTWPATGKDIAQLLVQLMNGGAGAQCRRKCHYLPLVPFVNVRFC